MYQKLLLEFTAFLEKQELLAKLSEKSFMHSYGLSEEHCIEAIGKLEKPNVTNISNHMHMTRGAISKITKKLLSEKIIEKYQVEGNKKEIYFTLTNKGKEIFQEHERRHDKYQKRDLTFLNQYDQKQIKEIKQFMKSYNQYLETKIKEMEENKC